MKNLFVIRHAKSSWEYPDLADFDRMLNERGLEDASTLGMLLASEMYDIELLVSSPAIRAITTAKLMAEAWKYERSAIVENKALYLASTSTILKIVNQLPDKVTTAAIFGHNPGFTDFINYAALADLDNLPTTGIVQIEFPVDSWSEVSAGMGTITYTLFPKHLR